MKQQFVRIFRKSMHFPASIEHFDMYNYFEPANASHFWRTCISFCVKFSHGCNRSQPSCLNQMWDVAEVISGIPALNSDVAANLTFWWWSVNFAAKDLYMVPQGNEISLLWLDRSVGSYSIGQPTRLQFNTIQPDRKAKQGLRTGALVNVKNYVSLERKHHLLTRLIKCSSISTSTAILHYKFKKLEGAHRLSWKHFNGLKLDLHKSKLLRLPLFPSLCMIHTL